MFVAAKSEAAQKRKELKEQQDQQAVTCQQAVKEFTQASVILVNQQVLKIHETQKLIEAEQAAVRQEVGLYQESVSRVSTQLRKLQDSLKQLGDFEHYLAVLHQEVEAVTEGAAALKKCNSNQQGQQAQESSAQRAPQEAQQERQVAAASEGLAELEVQDSRPPPSSGDT